MAKARKKSKRSNAAAELFILRLAAQSLDTRQHLTKADIERVPSLGKAFKALDAVMVELGWGNMGRADEQVLKAG
jgi:hypothetical protein